MYFLSVDRIEGKLAICEDDCRKRMEVNLSEIAGSPKEGDIIVQQNGIWMIDQEETQNRRARILELQKKLFSE